MIDRGYKTTADAMWLAEAARAACGGKKRLAVLDAGIGPGGVALSLLDDNPALMVAGVDVSDQMLSAAWLNALANNREIELIQSDIAKWKTSRLFDVVVTNPPYLAGTARKDKAHHNADIYQWTRVCAKRLRARGMFYCIVAPDVLDKVVAALYDSNCGEIQLTPIETKKDSISRVIISARAGVKTPAKINKSILIRNA